MHIQGGLGPVGKEGYAILTQFYEYDRTVPLDARVLDREENEASVREKIVFRGVRDGRVPGYLAMPTTASPPYPCVLLVHGLGASKEDWWKESSDEERLAPIAPRNFAPAITSAAFLMLSGKNDEWGTAADIQSLHELVASPSKALIFFDSGHRLPSEFVPKAVEWFRQHLK